MALRSLFYFHGYLSILFILTFGHLDFIYCLCDTEVIKITGAGSSLTAAMYQELGDIYSVNRTVDRNISFTFTKSNSVDGKNRIMLLNTYRTPIVFAASEDPLSDDEKSKYPELLIFPIIAGAVAIVFNLPQTKQLNLTVASLPEIFMGNIKYWNDSAIQSVNPAVTLPYEKIQPIVRADPAGNTVIFTSTLASASQTWDKSYGILSDPYFVGGVCCNSTAWPKAVKTFGNHAYGLTGMIVSIPYTIGYAPMVNTMETGNTYATIINSFGKLVQPNADGTQAAMDHVFINTTTGSPEGLQYDISNALHPNAYPFVSFSYMILNRTTHPNISLCQMEELTGFVSWLFTPVGRRIVDKFSLVPLSPDVSKFVIDKLLPLITSGNEKKFVYNEYLLSLIHPLITPSVMHIIITVAIFTTLILIGSVIFVHYYRKYRSSHFTQWILNDIQLINSSDQDCTTSNSMSLGTVSNDSKLDGETCFLKGRLANCEQVIFLSKFNAKRGFNWRQETKILFTKMLKQLNHQNLAVFLGVTIVDSHVYIVNQCGTLKGTLHHVLNNCPFQIDQNVTLNLTSDVLAGIQYLHRNHMPHGRITSLTCCMDSVWCVKIFHWEFTSVRAAERMETDPGILAKAHALVPVEDEEDVINLLYLCPNFNNLFHSDVYSFAILLYEIFTRQLPFSHEVKSGVKTFAEILQEKFLRNQFFPAINNPEIPELVKGVIRKILTEDSLDINKIEKLLKPLMGNKKSVVDILMQSMESYMYQLEEKVSDRTADLTNLTNKMRELLDDVLPKQISTKLFQGEPVEPEFFECCTVLFSDIVGFTTISARSSPTQVMTFLNELYTIFDNAIDVYDVYKVDTIGDAYMLASGLPVRNGINHCKNIGLLAMALMELGDKFKITHMPNEKLILRMGINCGPVTAGIIGNKMPQYCIFGDTVNTASRMESTSLPGKIQVSTSAHQLFVAYFPSFCFDLRGEVEVKGKGKMKTYWLMGNYE